MRIPFRCKVKIQSLEQFPVDHFPHSDVPSLLFLLCFWFGSVLVGRFTAYQPFPGHLTLNYVILTKVVCFMVFISSDISMRYKKSFISNNLV